MHLSYKRSYFHILSFCKNDRMHAASLTHRTGTLSHDQLAQCYCCGFLSIAGSIGLNAMGLDGHRDDCTSSEWWEATLRIVVCSAVCSL